MLIKYVYNKKNKQNPNRCKTGVIVALDNERIGFAKYNVKAEKLAHRRFDKDFGLGIAILRAMKNDVMINAENCPDSMKIDFIKMVNRANRYFK